MLEPDNVKEDSSWTTNTFELFFKKLDCASFLSLNACFSCCSGEVLERGLFPIFTVQVFDGAIYGGHRNFVFCQFSPRDFFVCCRISISSWTVCLTFIFLFLPLLPAFRSKNFCLHIFSIFPSANRSSCRNCQNIEAVDDTFFSCLCFGLNNSAMRFRLESSLDGFIENDMKTTGNWTRFRKTERSVGMKKSEVQSLDVHKTWFEKCQFCGRRLYFVFILFCCLWSSIFLIEKSAAAFESPKANEPNIVQFCEKRYVQTKEPS